MKILTIIILILSLPRFEVIVTNKNPFETGKELYFSNHCGSCHRTDHQGLIARGLKDATKRFDKEWLYKWVRSSTELIKSGDSLAIEIVKDYTLQPDYKHLTNDDIDNIFFYIDSLNRIKP